MAGHTRYASCPQECAAGEVLKFEAGEEPAQESKRLDIQEIINYRRAMGAAEHALLKRPFNLNLLLHLHSLLMDSVRGRDRGRGQFRRVQNWIGGSDTPIERAHFIPPRPEVLPEFLDNWEKYYHSEAPDPLVQLALIHAQFEILHPFVDGNGRLGRLVVPLYLYEKKVLSRPMFYLSSYLEAHRDEYIRRLRVLGRQKGAWSRWIEFFLTALIEQAAENSQKARDILKLYVRLKERVIGLTHSQFAVPLLDKFFQRPIFQSVDLEGLPNSPSKQAISTLLNRLKYGRILKVVRKGAGRRAQVLALAELVNLCEGRETV